MKKNIFLALMTSSMLICMLNGMESAEHSQPLTGDLAIPANVATKLWQFFGHEGLPTLTFITALAIIKQSHDIDKASIPDELRAYVLDLKQQINNSLMNFFNLRSLSNEDKEYIKLLVQAGADLTLKDENERTPLNLAAAFGAEDLIQPMIAAGANVHVKSKTGSTALIEAAKRGLKDGVDQLLKAGADPNEQDQLGFTALIAAAEKKHDDVVKQLIEGGADPNAQDRDRRTALMWSAESPNIVKLLLDAGADPLIKDDIGWTAKNYTSNPEVVELLQQASPSTSGS